MTVKKRKARVIWVLERPEIWEDGINRPVLYGCYKTRKCASWSKKLTDINNAKSNSRIRYGKLKVIKFKEVL